uniref:Cytoplasmic tRNA 2-thiolation protein 2 n=1 Tax=Parastrongyloides trichosuri TaxID=131310 RepID=A0A0N4ZL80_PARTI
MSTNGIILPKKCVKCSEDGPYFGFDARRASYCKDHFIMMVKQKFFFSLGKNRVFKGGNNKRNPLIIYNGDSTSSFLIGIIGEARARGPYKRLDVDPTIIAVTEKEDVNDIKEFVRKTKESLQSCGCPLHYIHLASIFDEEIHFNNEDVKGVNNITKLIEFYNLFKTPSAKVEINRLLWDLLYFKIGKELKADKVILPLCADDLARTTCNALCFGRGASIAHLTEIVDKRYTEVSLIRPLHGISQKEINLMLQFEIYNIWKVYENSNGHSSNSIQRCNEQFLNSLLQAGFPATIPTLLSISGKVRPNIGNNTLNPISGEIKPSIENNILVCKLCNIKYDSRDETQVMCQACFDFVDTEMESTENGHDILRKVISL